MYFSHPVHFWGAQTLRSGFLVCMMHELGAEVRGDHIRCERIKVQCVPEQSVPTQSDHEILLNVSQQDPAYLEKKRPENKWKDIIKDHVTSEFLSNSFFIASKRVALFNIELL